MKNSFHLHIFSLLFVLAGNFSFAQTPVIDSLKRVIAASKVDTLKANNFNKLSNEFREIHPDSVSFYAKKAFVLSQKNNYDFGEANALMNFGNAQIILSDYTKALQYFGRAKSKFEKLLSNSKSDILQVKNGLARAHASFGVVFSEENNYPRALENYFKALKLYQETNQKQSISKLYNNIGIVYKSQKNLPKALEFLLKSLKQQQENGEQTIAVTLTNIGAIYFELQNDPKALEYYDKAQHSFEKTNNSRGFALLQNYLGDYYKKQNEVEKAIFYYNESQRLYQKIDNKFGVALVLYNVGEVYLALQKYPEALRAVQKSLDLAKEIRTPDQVKESEKRLSDIYGLLGNEKQAFQHFRNYVRIKDSLENDENTHKLMRAEMNFEYEKKEALLHEKNKRQQQFSLFLILGGLTLLALIFVIYNRLQIKRRLTLQKEVAEYEQKALHLQMNPHFVFNCLGSISSFIVQNGTDSAIKYLSKFSKLMRLTLEYSKGSLIPIDKEIEGLQNYLELEQLRFNQKFDFNITASPEIEDDMALPPLLIQPFVENAILHGMVPKDGEGTILVHFDLSNDKLICTITDDGIGFNQSKLLKENSVKAHQSMALEITKKRLEMMQAETAQSAHVSIEELMENEKSAGTKVVISLPIQYTSDTKTRI